MVTCQVLGMTAVWWRTTLDEPVEASADPTEVAPPLFAPGTAK